MVAEPNRSGGRGLRSEKLRNGGEVIEHEAIGQLVVKRQNTMGSAKRRTPETIQVNHRRKIIARGVTA